MCFLNQQVNLETLFNLRMGLLFEPCRQNHFGSLQKLIAQCLSGHAISLAVIQKGVSHHLGCQKRKFTKKNTDCANKMQMPKLV